MWYYFLNIFDKTSKLNYYFFSIDGHQEFKTSIEDCISENNKLEYCKIVSDISHQLSKFYGLDESINPISSM